jgi:hypothetical protein
MKVGLASSPRGSVNAQQAYKDARKRVPPNWITEVCQTSMRLCSILGSHPNATSLGTMGLTPIDLATKMVHIPARVTDSAELDWHLDQMIRHGTRIVAGLVKVRSQTLSDSNRMELGGYCDQLLAAAKPFMEAALSGPRDDGDVDDRGAC